MPSPPKPTANAANDFDLQVPMLTDVLQMPRYPIGELPGKLSDVNWTALTERVRGNVLERLMQNSSALLGERLDQTLGLIVDRASTTLALELQDALTLMVKEIVAKAVDDELSRVHTEIAQRESM